MERAPNRIQHSPEPDIEPESYFELRASEQRYRKLIHNVPLPLWQVDTRAMSDVMESIKAAGITDIDGYLKERPKLVELASQAVVVTEVNDRAMRLFRGSDRPDFLRSVQYLFSGTPDAAARVMQPHFESRRNYVEEMQIHTFDGQLLDVVLLVTFPQAPESLDLTLIMMIDLTEQRRTRARVRRAGRVDGRPSARAKSACGVRDDRRVDALRRTDNHDARLRTAGYQALVEIDEGPRWRGRRGNQG